MKFTCTYSQSKKLLQQYHYYAKTGLSKWLWLGIVMIAGSVALYISTKEPIDLLFLVLGVGMGVKEVVSPFRKAAKEYDALLGKFGTEIPETTVTVDETAATLTFAEQETQLLLEDVLGIYWHKDFLVLSGFDKDIVLTNLPNLEEVKNFLDKHCKNAPLYKR